MGRDRKAGAQQDAWHARFGRRQNGGRRGPWKTRNERERKRDFMSDITDIIKTTALCWRRPGPPRFGFLFLINSLSLLLLCSLLAPCDMEADTMVCVCVCVCVPFLSILWRRLRRRILLKQSQGRETCRAHVCLCVCASVKLSLNTKSLTEQN